MGRYRFDTSYAEPVANALRGSVGEVASEVEVVPCPRLLGLRAPFGVE